MDLLQELLQPDTIGLGGIKLTCRPFTGQLNFPIMLPGRRNGYESRLGSVLAASRFLCRFQNLSLRHFTMGSHREFEEQEIYTHAIHYTPI